MRLHSENEKQLPCFLKQPTLQPCCPAHRPVHTRARSYFSTRPAHAPITFLLVFLLWGLLWSQLLPTTPLSKSHSTSDTSMRGLDCGHRFKVLTSTCHHSLSRSVSSPFAFLKAWRFPWVLSTEHSVWYRGRTL